MAILTEFFLLLELRDRVAATAETYQKKLIRRFKTAKEEGKLRGGSLREVQKELDKEQNLDASKAIVNHFAEHDPTKNNKYLDWIIRQFIKGHLLWEDSFKMRALLEDFEKYRKKLDKKDLNHYDSYHDLEEAVEPFRGTEVAGVRVQNFLKKSEVQRFRDSLVADPSDSMHHAEYDALNGEGDATDDIPEWFYDNLRESAEQAANDMIDEDEYMDVAYDELDKDDYTDDDGDFDEDQYEDDARDIAAREAEEARDHYIEEYVNEQVHSEWEEYVHNNKSEFEDSLDRSSNKTSELNVVYENDRLAVMIPNSREAACFIGKGTEWCTSSDESDNYWWEYTKDGPLYAVITDKIGKYQFHFESSQFMDEHDRFIEDSNALISLVKGYSKELQRAFDEPARFNDDWWLLPANEIPENVWSDILKQTGDVIGGGSEGVVRDVVRVWQAHKNNAPEGWAEEVRSNILTGRQFETALKNGWFGKIDNEAFNMAVDKGLEKGTINPVAISEYAAENNIELSPEAWRGLIMKTTDSLFYAPMEIIDRNLVDALLNKEMGERYKEASYLRDFYARFKTLRDREHNPDQHRWNANALERARKFANMITMDDIINGVIKDPDALKQFGMDFGMKPWIAAAQAAMNEGEEGVQAFINMASMAVGMNRNEPWTKDVTKLIYQLLTKYPAVSHYMSSYPEGEMPPETQHAILNYIASHENTRKRGEIIQSLRSPGTHGRFSPAVQDFMNALRTNMDPSSEEYLQLQQKALATQPSVPAQQQLEM